MLKVKYFDKYQKKFRDPFQKFSISNLDCKIINTSSVFKDPIFDNLLVNKIESNFLKYFICSNGFIGNDFYLLGVCASDLLFYWFILNNEDLTPAEKNDCKFKIERYFYFYLNCIYNIQQKFETFVDFKQENSKTFINTILTNSAEPKILDLFKKIHPHISKYSYARCDIVHDKYALEYIPTKNTISITCFDFDFTVRNLYSEIPKIHTFEISEKSILQPMESIYELTKGFLDIVRDLNNIDFNKLKDKFKSINDEKYTYKISF